LNELHYYEIKSQLQQFCIQLSKRQKTSLNASDSNDIITNVYRNYMFKTKTVK